MTDSTDSLLRKTFRANAALSGLVGLDMVLFGSRIADLLGLHDSRIVTFVGVGLLAWAGHLVVASRRRPLSLREAWYFVGGDFAWVVASVVLLLNGVFTTAGSWVVGIAAAVVLTFAELQIFGIRRLRAAPARRSELRPAA